MVKPFQVFRRMIVVIITLTNRDIAVINVWDKERFIH